MNYIDLVHLSKSLDNNKQALSDYKAFINRQIEATNKDLSDYINNNDFNLQKLSGIVANGIAISDLSEDLKNSIQSAKNAGIDITELIDKDDYLDSTKANKSEVYSKNESDRQLSDFYTKNEVDERVTSLKTSIDSDDTIQELSQSFNAYIMDSKLVIDELNKQLNVMKSTLPDVHNIVGVEVLNDLEVDIGTELGEVLKETVTVTLDNNELLNLPVIWQSNAYNKNLDGRYLINGIFSLPDNISNTNNLYPMINIIVIGDQISITAVDNFNNMYIEYGTTELKLLQQLPTNVNVTLSDGSQDALDIIWDLKFYSSRSISDQTISGILVLKDTITNPRRLTVTIRLQTLLHTIKEVPVIEKEYMRNYIIDFDLPSTVEVILDNDSVQTLNVTWDLTAIDTTAIGLTTISGTFSDLPINISNTNNVYATCDINIIENEKNITLIGRIADIEVSPNTSFEEIELSDHVVVTLEDGTTTNCKVVWDGSNYNGSEEGQYVIHGKLSTTEFTNFNNFIIECVIVVTTEHELEYAWSHKFIVSNGVSSIPNFQAQLGEAFTEDDFYGPFNQELDDYEYDKRRIEVRYLGPTLQEPDSIDTILVDKAIITSSIKKTTITDMYGNDGLLMPLGTQETSIKNTFDDNVFAAEESSNRAIDYYLIKFS